jgi:hypothetical protein
MMRVEDAGVSELVSSARGVEVTVDADPLGVGGLTVRVPGGPETDGAEAARLSGSRSRHEDPLHEYDEDDLLDPGGCEF